MAAISFHNASDSGNYLIVDYTFNSNRRILTPQAFEDFEQEMNILFKETMTEYSEYLFGNPNVVISVSIESYGVEVGPVQKRGHVHMNIKIVHKAPRYSIRKLNKRFKEWLNTASGTTGWAVYGVINKEATNKLNYANKRLRNIANAKVLNTGYEAEEIDRLSEFPDELAPLVGALKL